MALTNKKTVALQLEKVRKSLPLLFDGGDLGVDFDLSEWEFQCKVAEACGRPKPPMPIWAMIFGYKHEVSTRVARIPLKVKPEEKK